MAPADTPVARLADERVDHRFKGLPPDAEGRTLGQLAAERRSLFTGGFTTPVLALSEDHLAHNLALLERYARRHGLAFAPHGKTSMAPRLFERQLEHGAWGITLAVPHQARVARAFGVERIFLANELVDPAALHWVAAELDRDPAFRFLCYVDSAEGVALMDEALRAAPRAPGPGATPRPVEVVIELGAGAGARTGVRSRAPFRECVALAEAVAGTGTLRLAGVAGYEGEVPEATPATVTGWLRELTALVGTLDAAGHFAELDGIVLSAGGSAWFDAVAEVFDALPALSRPVLKLLRSGAYVSHDDGHYRDVTPFRRIPEEGGLRSAFTLWAQVVSRPEPGQAFLNAGKRDAAHDLRLPEPHTVRSARDGGQRPARGLTVTGLSDQHTWLRVDAAAEPPEVGDWVGLGMSHPCTIFDRWGCVPVVEGDGTVVEFVRTFF
ncbi:amino acid deaminase [Streptomyces sp. AJS327]|uniref:alanine racemase n=1 Tax=Streptomyces sp. AJS327 TaxID=2545265 RepID=UPI0015DF014A|nr:alanine racemase [Streptomyces sp. AJS327]MBA0051297.1 amino acid deaminase [Streptomyces sp. AJS327]